MKHTRSPIRKPAASRPLALHAVALAPLCPRPRPWPGPAPTVRAAAPRTALVETSHTNAFGGSSTHVAGEGTEHTNTYGGSTAHSEYGGTEHTNVYGGSTAGAYGAGAEHTTYYGATAYHPPGYGAYPCTTRQRTCRPTARAATVARLRPVPWWVWPRARPSRRPTRLPPATTPMRPGWPPAAPARAPPIRQAMPPARWRPARHPLARPSPR
jgi:hypothetical protein